MASIMTIRDKEGNIIDIPVIKGPPGPEGPEGPQGEQGVSGVYVGSGDMPESYNIQVDLNSSEEVYIPEEWTFTLEDGSTITKKILVVASE